MLFWKPSYDLIQRSYCNQVFTGVSPYHGSDKSDTIRRIYTGERPSRPIDPSQNRWLQDPAWDVITTGWHDQPNRRCELAVMYDIFMLPGQREVQNFKPGDLNAQNEGNLTTAGTSQTPKRRRRKVLPQIASFFQFLQNSESEIQREVNKMNKVTYLTHPLLRLTRLAASRE